MNNTLTEARAQARAGRLAQWVQAFLREEGGEHANPNVALADGLLLEERFYLGPVRIALGMLETVRVEADIPDAAERARYDHIVDQMAEAIPDWDMPPFIVEYRDGRLILTDGNHRFSALRRLGADRCEVIVWGAAVREAEARARLSAGWTP